MRPREVAGAHRTSGNWVAEDDLALFLWKAGFVDSTASARDHPYWERAMPHRMTLSWLSKLSCLQTLRFSSCPVSIARLCSRKDDQRATVRTAS